MAFVLDPPGRHLGHHRPRTMDQLTSLLKAGDIVLDRRILDHIDEIVPPGQDLNFVDHGWVPPWVGEPAQRRRP